MPDQKTLFETWPILGRMNREEEVVWVNPDKLPVSTAKERSELSMKDIDDTEARLKRFAPFIMRAFPETEARNGLIESELVRIPAMKEILNDKYHACLKGTLLLKKDSHLAIAGSVKARGGIYEVLKHTEELAIANGLLTEEDLKGGAQSENAYSALGDESARKIFSQYKVQVGSTGNLGMSIGIMSAAIGYDAIVHMSADAKQWKKDLLRSRGVTVVEYEADYGEAVKNGRKQSDADPMSYFVDDENSRDLFLGYAVAAKRLVGQLDEQGVTVDGEHPLFVYVPCGVGGAPGGITFGLKQVFGDNVHCFFVEPVQAPCMLAGMSSGLQNAISVQDIGLTGLTHADGLAVGRASGFVGGVMKDFLSGEFTVRDAGLYDFMRELLASENIFLEPSACASFMGAAKLCVSEETRHYIEAQGLAGKMGNASHIVWATGGSLVPESIREQYRNTYL
ncbi:MAG: D-serine ammonia-lyase [Lachnospiraceae bacterium]|nr:D-serine ammonia-lyase [Lachnospiraceae bacterium]